MAESTAAPGEGHVMQVVVASTAHMKVAAVQKLLAEEAASVQGVKAASGVNDQPFGHEETIRGALNRLADAKLKAPSADLYVSMENGLFEVPGDGRKMLCFDLAWVAIEDAQGQRSLAHSAGVEMPGVAVSAAKASCFSKTAGSEVARVANQSPSSDPVDPQDPHTYLTNGFCSREELLLSALRIALGQMKRKSTASGGGM
mmetsp:Transcript_11298/g.23844  ORF Transcript_11298/g.23844 Transcript_11298/m.23844 type:complete len:201 (-) Transcript_11298:46-648(-)